MPKQALKAEFKSFSQGLITESSELNAPENAFKDGVNFELNRDGSSSRRLGIDFEPAYTWISSSLSGTLLSANKIQAIVWEAAGGNPLYDFAVVNISNKLYIFSTVDEGISSNAPKQTLTLGEFSGYTDFSIAVVKNALIVACGSKKIGLIKYDTNTDSFSISYFSIKTRDLWGVPCYTVPTYDTDNQYRGGFDTGHIYNLYNQSWGIPRRNSSAIPSDPVTVYFTKYQKYPSDSETVWAGLQFQASSTPYERIFVNLYEEVLGASNDAAKGYFIIDALDRGASREKAFADNSVRNPALAYKAITLDKDSTSSGATVVAEYAGRVVYAGFNGELIGGNKKSPNLTDHIFFSQLVNNEGDYSKCYQAGDPTSRENADIVDTDGGFIRVTGAKKIVALRTIGEVLLVIATNGVWAVMGGNDNGFTATNYKVVNITSFGCQYPRSVIDDKSQVVYWGDDGIFTISRNQYGDYVASSISEKTIQSFYNNISQSGKQTVVGAYDMFAKKIRWIYSENGYGTGSRELVLDMTLGAFYPIEIKKQENIVVSAISLPAFRVVSSEQIVEAAGQTVVYDLDNVVVQSSVQVQNVQSLRYLVLKIESGIVKFTFAYYKNTSFLDWNEEDANGYITTVDYTHNDSSVYKQTPWIVTHMRATDTGVVSGSLENTSGCLLSSRWDWSTSGSSNKWSSTQQIYRPRVYLSSSTWDPGFKMVTTKNKMRGFGRAFCLNFQTEPGKDCKLVGWSIALNGTGIV